MLLECDLQSSEKVGGWMLDGTVRSASFTWILRGCEKMVMTRSPSMQHVTSSICILTMHITFQENRITPQTAAILRALFITNPSMAVKSWVTCAMGSIWNLTFSHYKINVQLYVGDNNWYSFGSKTNWSVVLASKCNYNDIVSLKSESTINEQVMTKLWTK